MADLLGGPGRARQICADPIERRSLRRHLAACGWTRAGEVGCHARCRSRSRARGRRRPIPRLSAGSTSSTSRLRVGEHRHMPSNGSRQTASARPAPIAAPPDTVDAIPATAPTWNSSKAWGWSQGCRDDGSSRPAGSSVPPSKQSPMFRPASAICPRCRRQARPMEARRDHRRPVGPGWPIHRGQVHLGDDSSIAASASHVGRQRPRPVDVRPRGGVVHEEPARGCAHQVAVPAVGIELDHRLGVDQDAPPESSTSMYASARAAYASRAPGQARWPASSRRLPLRSRSSAANARPRAK